MVERELRRRSGLAVDAGGVHRDAGSTALRGGCGFGAAAAAARGSLWRCSHAGLCVVGRVLELGGEST